MHLRPARLAPLLSLAAVAGFAQAQEPTAFPATVAGHTVMPAASYIPAPRDAPADLKMSGKFTAGKRVEVSGTVERQSAGRPTGVSLPFTIENVDVVDATHIVVGNDNNLPFSSSREPNKADNNELILLEVGELLRAK